MIYSNSKEAFLRAKCFCVLIATESMSKIWCHLIAFSPSPPTHPTANELGCCKSDALVVLLVLTYCLLLLPLFVRAVCFCMGYMFGPVLCVLLVFTSPWWGRELVALL